MFFDLSDKQSLTTKVYNHIRNGILDGSYKDGDFLVETRLAEELEVSRTPIREALKQLELEGLVKTTHNKGAVVVGISERDVDDIYTIRVRIEGLAARRAAENITMGDLKGALTTIMRKIYGEDAVMRFRPHHFPFTEPSCEMDMQCHKCHGTGEIDGQVCSTCHGEGWIELLGAGMVHPKVLENCGIDPEKYSGFAFGMGLERMAMGRMKINDLRLIFDNDIRFLNQF